MSQKAPTEFDLLIAGGGATGLALVAMLLKHTELRIGLIEAAAPPDTNHRQSDFLELRSIALSAQSCEILGELGLDSLAEIACPITTIHVSDQGHLGQCTLRAEDYHMAVLGQVVELPALVAQLHQQIQDAGNRLHVFYQSEITDLTRTQTDVTVILSGGECLSAQLLVVAEGGQSKTREKLGIEAEVEDYQQTALVANVELATDHQNWAFERFTAQGPLALLPLKPLSQANNKHRGALVWTLSHPRYQQLIAMNDHEFIADLQREFGFRLGEIKNVGRRSGFPLTLRYAEQHIHHRAVLIGNACQSLHPIAGQGLNLALRDVKQLADLLIAHRQEDIGQYSLLHRYQRQRKQDQQRLTFATDTLVRTFSNSYLPFVIGRNLALTALDNIPALKQSFAITAMGFKGTTGERHAKL
ncbi:2-octaprenyl-6-methoxyphenyl hydroxylase [Aliiglaciecola litoralis]|uniref:2-octaprenyl-6-methoxyphenyl hydroxylase n=1 Tax=Aliiglaciecola litoralis TaxID=582857 RepID=A0ABN1LQH4_9ALTE